MACDKFAVVTGCLRISKESIFTGTNHFVPDTISDSRLYVEGLKKLGYAKIYAYGIACFKKHCKVVCQETDEMAKQI